MERAAGMEESGERAGIREDYAGVEPQDGRAAPQDRRIEEIGSKKH